MAKAHGGNARQVYWINIIVEGERVILPQGEGEYFTLAVGDADDAKAIRYGNKVAKQYGGTVEYITRYVKSKVFNGGMSHISKLVYGVRPAHLNSYE